ncbi:MAG: cupin domain-containing protein [Emcibacter sp.]|nr:cupin domain-containing protein [Emcibacter sp.]
MNNIFVLMFLKISNKNERLNMVWKVRRVVTGHNEQGESTVIFDGNSPHITETESMPGLFMTELWETSASPVDNKGQKDSAERQVTLDPPENGSVFRIVEFPPEGSWRDSADGSAAFASMGASDAHQSDSSDPMMHKTNTIDYIVIIKGEIYAILDDSETLLRQGDTFIQRGTVHSWRVNGNEPCVLAVVLINANPV